MPTGTKYLKEGAEFGSHIDKPSTYKVLVWQKLICVPILLRRCSLEAPGDLEGLLLHKQREIFFSSDMQNVSPLTGFQVRHL